MESPKIRGRKLSREKDAAHEHLSASEPIDLGSSPLVSDSSSLTNSLAENTSMDKAINKIKQKGRSRKGSLTRSKSISAAIFLENENEKGSHILIRDMESIEWFKESNLGEFCFKLELRSSKFNEYVFICETKEDLAGWMIAIDALISSSQSNSFNTYVKPLSDKKIILKMLHKDDYKGGIIKSSYDEEWQYEPNGTTTLLSAPDAPKGRVVYEWDGEMFTPKPESLSFGAGQWSGVFVGWYLDEWEPFKTSTKRDKFLKYFYDQDSREYIPGITAWKWTRHFLASKSNEGEWIVEGNIPEPVVIFLQLMRYSRTGIKGNPEMERKIPDSLLTHLPKPPPGAPPEPPKIPEIKKTTTPTTTINSNDIPKTNGKVNHKNNDNNKNWVPKVGGIIAFLAIAVVVYQKSTNKE